ncbi:MAG: hypothetical protein R3F59_21720 [Myxococcota bacterium]
MLARSRPVRAAAPMLRSPGGEFGVDAQEAAFRDAQALVPIEPFPFLAEIERQLGADVPGRAVEDPFGCAELGVEAFTEGLVTHFAERRPRLEVAAHEAAHLLQHGGRTGDGGLGAEGHAQQVAAAVTAGDGAQAALTDEGGVDGDVHAFTPAPAAPAPAPAAAPAAPRRRRRRRCRRRPRSSCCTRRPSSRTRRRCRPSSWRR